MTKRLKWPLAALLLAAAGAMLRRWQTLAAYEPELRLCDPLAPSSLTLTAFLLLAAALLALLARKAPVEELPGNSSDLTLWDLAFAAKGDTGYLTLMVLAGFAVLAAAPLLFMESAEMMKAFKAAGEGERPFLQLVLMVCAIPGGLGLIMTARAAARQEGAARERSALLFPPLLNCVWLLEAYRSNAADPVLWNYAPMLFAVAAGLLFHLDCAGMALGSGKPRRMLWLAGIAALLSGTALGGAPSLSAVPLLAGQLLTALAALWLAPGNLERMPDPAGFGIQDDGPASGTDSAAEPAGGASAEEQAQELEDNTNGQ